MNPTPRLAVVIPCLNEELTVGAVVSDCRHQLPEAQVYVFDNNSTDATSERARQAGALVVSSLRPGKGAVIDHAFGLLDADVLFVLDGDGTYSADQLGKMRDLILNDGFDMVVCARQALPGSKKAYPMFHRLGNVVFSGLVSSLLGETVTDVFSGYRAFSRNFFESLVLESKGFEIESELTLKAFSHGFHVKEIQGPYGERPLGSTSKLRTFGDGARILKFILLVLRDCRPLFFFGWAAALCFVLSLLSGIEPILDYIQFHYVYTVPRAILAASLMVLSLVFFGVGLILDSQIRNFRDQSKLMRRWLARSKITRA